MTAVTDESSYYYGSINWISVNLGYHLEHRGLPHVAGWRLPPIHQLTPQFYADHYIHKSHAMGL